MATISLAHTAVQSIVPATGNTPDPIQLHMQALNSLSRCKAMLTSREPMYLFAQQLFPQAPAIRTRHCICKLCGRACCSW